MAATAPASWASSGDGGQLVHDGALRREPRRDGLGELAATRDDTAPLREAPRDHSHASIPPSTMSAVPVVPTPPAPARYAYAAAISGGTAERPIAIRAS